MSLRPCDCCGDQPCVDGEHYCPRCLYQWGDDDTCDACGSLLTNDRACVCDLNRPAADWTHWRAA